MSYTNPFIILFHLLSNRAFCSDCGSPIEVDDKYLIFTCKTCNKQGYGEAEVDDKGEVLVIRDQNGGRIYIKIA